MSKSKSLIYLSIFIIIVTIGCFHSNASPVPDKVDLTTLDPNLYDQSWLTNDTCEVECWHGLKPGVTSEENAKLMVSELPFIDKSKMMEYARNARYPCKVPKETTCVFMTFGNGDLEFLFVHPNYPITIEQAVEKLGNPDGYEYSPTDPGATGCFLGVVWMKKQLELQYIEYRSDIPFWSKSLCEQIRYNNGKLPKDLIISDVVFMSPSYIGGVEKYNTWVGFSHDVVK